MDEVALGEAAPATMRDVTYARQQFDTPCIIPVSECEECLAELQQQRILGIWRRRTAYLDRRQRIKDALRGRNASCGGERHHRMRSIEWPHANQVLPLPAIGQQLPALAHPEIQQLEAP